MTLKRNLRQKTELRQNVSFRQLHANIKMIESMHQSQHFLE